MQDHSIDGTGDYTYPEEPIMNWNEPKIIDALVEAGIIEKRHFDDDEGSSCHCFATGPCEGEQLFFDGSYNTVAIEHAIMTGLLNQGQTFAQRDGRWTLFNYHDIRGEFRTFTLVDFQDFATLHELLAAALPLLRKDK